MWMPCERWYEEYLGCCCDNDCENCYGNNENVFAKDDFSITGEMLSEVKIKKGERFWIYSETIDRVLLKDDKNKEHFYHFQKDFIKEHFSYEEVKGDG